MSNGTQPIGTSPLGGIGAGELFSYLKVSINTRICITLSINTRICKKLGTDMSTTVNPQVGSTPTIELIAKDQDGNLVDLSTASVEMYLMSPQNTVTPKTASKNDPATDGVIKYTCLTADLDVPGAWLAQGKAIFDDGSLYYTEVEEFTVEANLG